MITRERVREFVEHKRFQQVVIWVIVVNAVTLGLETSTAVVRDFGGLLHVADRVMLAVFVVELGLRLYAYGLGFFRDSWNVFDFAVVAVSLVPATGPFSVRRRRHLCRQQPRSVSRRRSVAGWPKATALPASPPGWTRSRPIA